MIQKMILQSDLTYVMELLCHLGEPHSNCPLSPFLGLSLLSPVRKGEDPQLITRCERQRVVVIELSALPRL